MNPSRAPELTARWQEHLGRVPWWRLFRVGAWAAAAVQVLLVATVVVRRVGYPYELEWMEGGMVEHVRRFLVGEPLYVVPSLEFVSYLYPPLYYVVSAPLASALGVDFLALRITSLVATLGCAALVYHLAARPDTTDGKPDREAGAVAAVLFLGAYFAGGAWYDLARVDMLFLALLLGTVAAARRRTRGGYALAGLLLGLAVLTKQPALVAGFPLLAYALGVDRWRAWPFVAGALLVGGGGLGALHLASGGWSTFYIFTMPAGHPLVPSSFVLFVLSDLFDPMPVGVCLAAAAVVAAVRRSDAFWLAVVVGVGASSFLARVHEGGFVNVLIPLYAVGAVLAGRGLTVFRGAAERMGAGRPAALALLYGALLVQFFGLPEDPKQQVPTPEDRAAGARLEARLAALPRPAYIASDGYLAVRAGHPRQADLLAVWDVTRSDTGAGRRLRAAFEAAYAGRRFARVVVPQGYEGVIALPPGYRRVEDLAVTAYDASDAFERLTGAPGRSRYVYAPPEAAGPSPRGRR